MCVCVCLCVCIYLHISKGMIVVLLLPTLKMDTVTQVHILDEVVDILPNANIYPTPPLVFVSYVNNHQHSLSIYRSLYIYIYIYIYGGGETDRQTDRQTDKGF